MYEIIDTIGRIEYKTIFNCIVINCPAISLVYALISDNLLVFNELLAFVCVPNRLYGFAILFSMWINQDLFSYYVSQQIHEVTLHYDLLLNVVYYSRDKLQADNDYIIRFVAFIADFF